MTLTSAARIEGGLLGLLIGDALGVPYEFHPPEQLPSRELLEFHPPADFRRAHASAPPGTWSDDGAQALCLLASLLEYGRLDLDDFGRRLLAGWEQGYLAVDGRVFDIGNQTRIALRQLAAGVHVEKAARREVHGFERRVKKLAKIELAAIDLHRPPGGNGRGYVVECLHSARLALTESSYEGVVKAAIAIGHDTDTTAAVAGGIAGVAFGTEGIPERWRQGLRGRELLDPLLDGLLAVRA
jgi:ADP-ribosylglycohydrolase